MTKAELIELLEIARRDNATLRETIALKDATIDAMERHLQDSERHFAACEQQFNQLAEICAEATGRDLPMEFRRSIRVH